MGSPCPTNLTLGSDITTSTTIAKSTITDIRASIEAEFTRRSNQYGNYYFPKDNMGGNNPTLEGWNYGYMWGGPWTAGAPGQSAGSCTHHVAMGSPAIPTCNDLTISDPITTKEINELWSGFRGSRRWDNWGLYCPTDNSQYGNGMHSPSAYQHVGPDYGSGGLNSNQGEDSGRRISRGVTAVEAGADPGYGGQWPDHWGIRRLIEELDEFKTACLCDCDYCTCDCNACNCDCAYCTCDCNQCSVDNSNQGSPYSWGYCPWHYMWRTRTYSTDPYGGFTCGDFSVKDNTVTEIPPTCTCDCAYCTCDCAYCTCDCNYCTCNCNFCTCNCNAGK